MHKPLSFQQTIVAVPTIGAQELNTFFNEFRHTIENLERAYQSNVLSKFLNAQALERILGTAAVNNYRELLEQPAHHDPHGHQFLIDRLSRCLSRCRADRAGMAYELQAMFNRAIDSPINDPRGPLALVPEALREFVCAYVYAESCRSTRALRSWQKLDGRYVTTSTGTICIRETPATRRAK